MSADRRDEQSGGDSRITRRLLTIPNVICGLRLALSPGLIVLAYLDQPFWFLVLYVFLAMTDWIDGKLAILLNQRTVIGARLDSAADITLYACLLTGGVWLAWPVIQQELVWLVLAITTYIASAVLGRCKFGKFPTYHTRAAKTSWLLILIAAVCVFSDRWVWTMRLALLAVTLTNLEALLISLVLSSWQADVPSLWHALRLRGSVETPRNERHHHRQSE